MAGAAEREETVAERLARSDGAGPPAPDCREVAGLFAQDAVRVARRFWAHFGAETGKRVEGEELDGLVPPIFPYLAAKYPDAAGQDWLDMVAGFVEEANRDGVGLSALISSIAAA